MSIHSNPEILRGLAAERAGRLRREADEFRRVRQAAGRHRRVRRWPSLRRAGGAVRHKLAS